MELDETEEFLPLGSVVSLAGNEKQMMVIGRALIVEDEDARESYDYGFCLYPEGVEGDVIIYANHDSIDEVHFRGFECVESLFQLDCQRELLSILDVPKADPKPISAW